MQIDSTLEKLFVESFWAGVLWPLLSPFALFFCDLFLLCKILHSALLVSVYVDAPRLLDLSIWAERPVVRTPLPEIAFRFGETLFAPLPSSHTRLRPITSRCHFGMCMLNFAVFWRFIPGGLCIAVRWPRHMEHHQHCGATGRYWPLLARATFETSEKVRRGATLPKIGRTLSAQTERAKHPHDLNQEVLIRTSGFFASFAQLPQLTGHQPRTSSPQRRPHGLRALS